MRKIAGPSVQSDFLWLSSKHLPNRWLHNPHALWIFHIPQAGHVLLCESQQHLISWSASVSWYLAPPTLSCVSLGTCLTSSTSFCFLTPTPHAALCVCSWAPHRRHRLHSEDCPRLYSMVVGMPACRQPACYSLTSFVANSHSTVWLSFINCNMGLLLILTSDDPCKTGAVGNDHGPYLGGLPPAFMVPSLHGFCPSWGG